jgi:DNA polymerase delta subunit 1
MPLAPEVAAITMDAVQEASAMAVALAERVNARLKAPKKIEFEKVFATMLLLSKKRYAGIKYEPHFKFGIDTPTLDVKGLQSVRRDGSPLVRELVRDVIQSILESGSEVDAAAVVRRRLLDIVEDRVEYESFAVKKTLRKSMGDCCFPMRPAELQEVRRRLGLSNISNTAAADQKQEQQLSYAEQDQAIYAKITLPWRPRVRLPHVLLAWRLRLRDPGSAPVPGESICYIICNNGGGKVFEKVETLDAVRTKHLPVDRSYYLKSLRTPIDNIFLPIMMQRIALAHPKLTTDEMRVRAVEEVKILIWNIIKHKRFAQAADKQKVCIAASPIAMAFAKQRQLPPASSAAASHKSGLE